MKNIPQMEPWLDENEINAMAFYMRAGGWLTEFKQTEKFAELIADYTGAKYCVIVNNGTISLSLALLALGVKAGDEVIVPDMTMIATPNSAKLIGASPVFVDVEPTTLCMDIEKVESLINDKTRAIIYVSLNGRTGNIFKIKELCERKNIAFIEDAAQSLGSFWNGGHLGTFSKIGSFSFSAPKVITTGQGGALITNDEKVADRLRKLKDFGRTCGGNDIHASIGYNFKFTDIQAVVGIEQMKKLSWRVKRKKEIYELYRKNLAHLEEVEMIPTNLHDTSPWFIDIFVQEPDRLEGYLKEKKVGSRRIYPAIHTQEAYKEFNDLSFPVSEDYCKRGLWLPSSSKLTDEEIEYICETIELYFKERNFG